MARIDRRKYIGSYHAGAEQNTEISFMVGYLGQAVVYKPVQDAERLHSLGNSMVQSDSVLMAV